MMSTNNKQARGYCFTINNYEDKGFTPADCEALLQSYEPVDYYIFSLEVGLENKTPHIQGYVHFTRPLKFNTLKNLFNAVNPHLESAMGSAQQNKEYITKGGKWTETDKALTSTNAIYEWGTMPQQRKGKRTDITDLYDMIKDGMNTVEILEKAPKYMRYVQLIEKTRQTLLEEQNKNIYRDVEVVYIYGKSRTNKTRSVLDANGYDNVYRVTDYRDNSMFDGYRNEDILLFEEFRSQITISAMLTYLEGYPLSLPARYANKVACYTKVYIISNIPLEKQYQNIQQDSPDTWKAFLKRIREVRYHYRDNNDDIQISCYSSVDDYLKRNEEFHTIDSAEFVDMPFED